MIINPIYSKYLTIKTNCGSILKIFPKNTEKTNYAYTDEANSQMRARTIVELNRGDYLQLRGEYGVDEQAYNQTSIIRLS